MLVLGIKGNFFSYLLKLKKKQLRNTLIVYNAGLHVQRKGETKLIARYGLKRS